MGFLGREAVSPSPHQLRSLENAVSSPELLRYFNVRYSLHVYFGHLAAKFEHYFQNCSTITGLQDCSTRNLAILTARMLSSTNENTLCCSCCYGCCLLKHLIVIF